MDLRYYLQTRGPKPSLRRYGNGVAERWDRDERKWSSECAAEQACIITGDTLLTEQQAEKITTKP